MKKFITIAASLIMLLSNTLTVFAEDIKLKQIFTPERDGIPFDGEGLAYPSFNNFTDNPNIGNALYNDSSPYQQLTDGDERVFTHVKHQCKDGGTNCCPAGDLNPTATCKYYDTIGIVDPVTGSQNLEIGDILRFQIYFHNNGSDTYDSNTAKDSVDARTVKVGIDVTDISSIPSDPEPNIIRPKGFISAIDNTYIIDGQTLLGQTATDDTQAFYAPNLTNVSLQIVPNSAYLEMNTDGDNSTIELSQYITQPTGIEFDTDIAINPAGYDVNVTPIYQGTKAWLQFDKLPGCFRYSGLAYFDVEVVAEEQPNYCESLTLTNVANQCELDAKATVFELDLTFILDPLEDSPQYVKIESPADPTGSIYIDGEYYDLPEVIEINETSNPITGIYFGIGQLEAKYSEADGTPITEEFIPGSTTPITVDINCYDSIQTCKNECDNICVTHPIETPVGSWSVFSGQATDYIGGQWYDEILYSVEDGYGEFYSSIDDLIAAHPDAYPNPHGSEICTNFAQSQDLVNVISNAITGGDDKYRMTKGLDSPRSKNSNNRILPATDTSEENDENSRFQNNLFGADIFGTEGLGTPSTETKIQPTSQTGSDFEFETSNFEFGTNPEYGSGSFETADGTGISEIDLGNIDTGFELESQPEDPLNPVDTNPPDFGNLNLICPEDAGFEGLKAPQDTPVYFYAAKKGLEKIKVEGECDDGNCEEYFDIIDVKCSSLSFANEPVCIEDNQSNIFEISEIEFTTKSDTDPKTFTVGETQSSTFWATTPPNTGFFFAVDAQDQPTGDQENLLLTTYKNVWYTGEKSTVTTSVNKLGEIYISDNTACKETYEPCADIDPVCQDLAFNVYDAASGLKTNATPATLPASKNYMLESFVTYEPANPTYSTDYKLKNSAYGRLYESMENPQLPGTYIPVQSDSTTEITEVPLNKRVFFFPNKNLDPGIYPEALKITATDSSLEDELGCTKYVALTVSEVDACEIIVLNTDPSWSPNAPATTPESTELSIDGDPGAYEGPIQFTVTGNGAYLSKDNVADPDLNPKPQTLTTTISEAIDGVYLFGPTLETSWTASVIAIEEDNTKCYDDYEYKYDPPGEDPVCQNLTIIEPAGSWTLNGSDEQDFEVEIQSNPANYVWPIKWDVTASQGAPTFEHQTTTSKTNVLKNVNDTAAVEIYVPGQPNCIDTKTVTTTPTTVSPSIKKYVKNGELDDKEEDANDGDWDDLINIQGQEEESGNIPEDSKYVTYKITFYPGEGKSVSSALIQEKSFETDGEIEGSQGGKLTFDQDEEEETLTIEVKENSNKKYLSHDEDELDICEYDKDGNLDTNKVCVSIQDYEDFVDEEDGSDIEFQDLVDAFADNDEGLVFNNIEDVSRIRIYYEMENETNLTKGACQDLDPEKDGCGEKFVNEAYFEAFKNDDLGTPKVDDGDDETEVVAICQFIITRSAGDVFFNSPLKAGIDVAFCSEQKNIQGPTIKGILESDPEIPKTGAGDLEGKTFLTTPTHDICKYSNVEGATEGAYDNPLKSFSSTICEMQAEVAEGWQKEHVVNQINANISKLTKWHTGGLDTEINGQAPQNATSNIYSWENKEVNINNLEISSTNPPLTQTYVVRNGDLNINGDIKYQDLGTTGLLGALILKQIPSAAFIVIDGDINIHEDVEQLDGVFIAIDTDDLGDDGNINSTGISYTQLTINGILVGDVTNLFEQRRLVGDISQDEGSVTIKFSENFLLNTPPGLSELLDLTQLRVAY